MAVVAVKFLFVILGSHRSERGVSAVFNNLSSFDLGDLEIRVKQNNFYTLANQTYFKVRYSFGFFLMTVNTRSVCLE